VNTKFCSGASGENGSWEIQIRKYQSASMVLKLNADAHKILFWSLRGKWQLGDTNQKISECSHGVEIECR
jgi:hypothetical protein